MKELDCRGLACPKPVLKAKEALDTAGDELISVLVDNEPARENVAKFFRSQGWEVSVAEPSTGVWSVTAAPPTCELVHGDDTSPERGVSAGSGAVIPDQDDEMRTLVFTPSDRVGPGDDELGHKLMLAFIATLKEMGESLWRLVLVNSGVKLAITGSPVLQDLKDLEKSGISILVCGTCLDFFGILDQKEVGETTNMLDIITSMELASKVIRV